MLLNLNVSSWQIRYLTTSTHLEEKIRKQLLILIYIFIFSFINRSIVAILIIYNIFLMFDEIGIV